MPWPKAAIGAGTLRVPWPKAAGPNPHKPRRRHPERACYKRGSESPKPWLGTCNSETNGAKAVLFAAGEESTLNDLEMTSKTAGGTPELPKPLEPMNDNGNIQRLQAMPKEVGVLLVVAGIGGLLMPGPIGTPFLILGGVVLWPRAFQGAQTAMARWFPRLHRQGMRQIHRFLDDLERRYPYPK
jgi:hypothetical protein